MEKLVELKTMFGISFSKGFSTVFGIAGSWRLNP